MKVLSIVGARPQFVKLAPIDHALRAAGVEHVIVHTGQHYDERMSGEFFSELDISAPDVNLNVGSAGHGAQTGAMLGLLDDVHTSHDPDWVLVYGDTNSTLAGAVSAADLLLAPTTEAMRHLAAEGLAERSTLVGDVMTDVLFDVRARQASGQVTSPDLGFAAGEYYLSTIHRAENTDDPERLRAVVEGLQALDKPVVLLAHPRLVSRCADHGIDLAAGAIELRDPMKYPDLVAAAAEAAAVVTDSGGLQKEAFLLRTPCVTV